MEAGKLRYRIGLYKPGTATANAAGETIQTLTLEDTVYADVQQPSAREQIRNGATEASKDYAILIRYRPDIDASWEIDFQGARLRVSGITPIGFKRGLSILAHE